MLQAKRLPLAHFHILGLPSPRQPMPIMIWLAAAVEVFISNWVDMWILLGIQFLNASLSYYETTKVGTGRPTQLLCHTSFRPPTHTPNKS